MNITILILASQLPKGTPLHVCCGRCSEPPSSPPKKEKASLTALHYWTSLHKMRGWPVTWRTSQQTFRFRFQIAIPCYPNRVLSAENDKMHWESSPTCLLSLWEDVEALLWVGVDVLWAGDMPFSSEFIAAISLGMCTWDHPNLSNSQTKNQTIYGFNPSPTNQAGPGKCRPLLRCPNHLKTKQTESLMSFKEKSKSLHLGEN